MPIESVQGETFVAFVDIPGFKKVLAGSYERASRTLAEVPRALRYLEEGHASRKSSHHCGR